MAVGILQTIINPFKSPLKTKLFKINLFASVVFFLILGIFSFLIIENPREIFAVLFTLGVFIFLFNMFIAIRDQHFIFYRLEAIGKEIKQIQDGKSSIFLPDFIHKDEITELIEDFNLFFAENLSCKEIIQKKSVEYDLMVKNIDLLVIKFLPDGQITYSNGYYKNYNTSKCNNIFDFIAEEDVKRMECSFRKLTPEKNKSIIELPIIFSNNEVITFKWINQGIFDKHGRILEYQGIGIDINKFIQK